MGVGIGSGDMGFPNVRQPIKVSELIETIKSEADDALFGRITGVPKADGVMIAGNGKYVDRVYDDLVRDGLSAIFREGDKMLPNLHIYRIDVDELFGEYNNRGLIED